MKPPANQPDALLAWMECLADETRLRLLRLLERHELGVGDLCDVLQLPQSTVSRHLKILNDQHWVKSQRQGTNNLYRMILDELDSPARRLWLLTREQTESWATLRQDQLRLTRRLSERERHTQEFFAGAAAQWDKLRSDLYGDAFTLHALLSLLPQDYTIADLGCGTGALLQQLAPHVKNVIGIDNSPAMLKAAHKRTADLPNVDLRRGDLHAIPIDNTTTDAALLLLVLTYLPDPLAALKESARILKPNAKLIIVDLLPHDREDFQRTMGQQSQGFDPPTLEKLLHESGFPHPTITPLPPAPHAKGPALFLATCTKPQ